jgi:hypothetical protein
LQFVFSSEISLINLSFSQSLLIRGPLYKSKSPTAFDNGLGAGVAVGKQLISEAFDSFHPRNFKSKIQQHQQQKQKSNNYCFSQIF